MQMGVRRVGVRMRDRARAGWQRHVDPGFAPTIKKRAAQPGAVPEANLVLVAYNRQRMLREGLASLRERTGGPSFEAVVRDNASTGILRDVVVYHACGMDLNESYGYFDLYRRKYEEAAEFADLAAQAARRAEERSREPQAHEQPVPGQKVRETGDQ